MPSWKDGFLDFDNMQIVRQLIITKYSDYRDLLLQANQIAVINQHTIEIHADNDVELISSCYYSRTLATIQASVILLETGMLAQSHVLLRSALECLFALGAIANNNQIIEKLKDNGVKEQKRIARNLQKLDDSLQSELHLDEKADIINELNNKQINPIDTFSLASQAGLEDWYRTTYMRYSWSTHGCIIDLDGHIVTSPTGEIAELKSEPEISCQESTWVCCIEMLLMSSDFLGKIFPEVDLTSTTQINRQLHQIART